MRLQRQVSCPPYAFHILQGLVWLVFCLNLVSAHALCRGFSIVSEADTPRHSDDLHVYPTYSGSPSRNNSKFFYEAAWSYGHGLCEHANGWGLYDVIQ
jgi:hypothetical protein